MRREPGRYSLSKRFDGSGTFRRLSRLVGNGVLDDAWRLATAFLDVLLHDDPQVYGVGEIAPQYRALLAKFDAELRPLAERLRLLVIGWSDAKLYFEEVLRRLREGKGVAEIVENAQGISEIAKLAEILGGAKGRDRTVRMVLRGEVDRRRLEIAKRVVVIARTVGRIVSQKLASLRRIGPGYEPAHAGGLQDPRELARMLPLGYALLATSAGPVLLAQGLLPAIKTYAVGSRGVEKPRSLGVVIDVSGSMAGEEIVVATGIGIAMFLALKPRERRLGFFDTTFKEVADPAQFLDYLLTVRAGGGTNIAKAVESALESWPSVDRVVVVSDGRDHPPSINDERVRYVIVTEDGWKRFGWEKRSDAWLVRYENGRVRVAIR